MDYRTRMRNIREDRDLTQKQVGEIINKSQQGYNHIETGRAELKIEDLIKLCQFYRFNRPRVSSVTSTHNAAVLCDFYTTLRDAVLKFIISVY